MTTSPFEVPISEQVWKSRYRFVREGEKEPGVEHTWRRVARALASVEKNEPGLWEERFHALLEGFRFLPGGRILAGAGTGREVTLFNCFVMGRIGNSLESLFDNLKRVRSPCDREEVWDTTFPRCCRRTREPGQERPSPAPWP